MLATDIDQGQVFLSGLGKYAERKILDKILGNHPRVSFMKEEGLSIGKDARGGQCDPPVACKKSVQVPLAPSMQQIYYGEKRKCRQECERQRARMPEAKLEGAESTLRMMECIYTDQKQKITELEVKVIQMRVRKRVEESRSICMLTVAKKKIMTDRRRSEMRVKDLEKNIHGICQNSSTQLNCRPSQIEAMVYSLKTEGTVQRLIWKAETNERRRLIRRIEADGRSILVRTKLDASNLRSDINIVKTERNAMKAIVRMKRRYSYRVIEMLTESLSDAYSVDTQNETVMEVVWRQSILKKMAKELESKIISFVNVEGITELRPHMLVLSRELLLLINDLTQRVECLKVRWKRKILLLGLLQDRKEEIFKLKNYQKYEELKVLQQFLDTLQLLGPMKAEATLHIIEASQRQLDQLIEIDDQQDKQYKPLLRQVQQSLKRNGRLTWGKINKSQKR